MGFLKKGLRYRIYSIELTIQDLWYRVFDLRFMISKYFNF